MEAETTSKALWSQVQKGAQPLNPIVPQLRAHTDMQTLLTEVKQTMTQVAERGELTLCLVRN